MIAYISGVISHKTIDKIIVEACGIGYEINISAATFEKLPPLNHSVKLYISESTGMYASGTTFYGFYSSEEKDVFLLLKSVSKVGAKGALDILSKISKSLPLFYKSIHNRDVKTLVTTFNLTKKTADKLILGLKDKLPEAIQTLSEEDKGQFKNLQDINDAVAGLMAMGFPLHKAKESVEQSAHDLEGYQVTDLIKHSLKLLRG